MTWKNPHSRRHRSPTFDTWHGTRVKFDEFAFDPEIVGFGIHSGTETQANELANGYRMLPLNISIKNPVRLVDKHIWDAEHVWRQLVDYGIIPDPGNKTEIRMQKMKNEADRVLLVKKILAKHGYDGIVYLNRYEGLEFEEQQRLRQEEDNIDYEPDDSLSFPMDDEDVKNIAPSARDSYIAFYPEQIQRRPP